MPNPHPSEKHIWSDLTNRHSKDKILSGPGVRIAQIGRMSAQPLKRFHALGENCEDPQDYRRDVQSSRVKEPLVLQGSDDSPTSDIQPRWMSSFFSIGRPLRSTVSSY